MVKHVEDVLRESLERWTRRGDEAIPALAGKEEEFKRRIQGIPYRFHLQCQRMGPNRFEMTCTALPEGEVGRSKLVHHHRYIPSDSVPKEIEQKMLERASQMAETGEGNVRRYLAGCHGAWPSARIVAERLAKAYAREWNYHKAFCLLAESGRFPHDRHNIFTVLCRNLERRPHQSGMMQTHLLLSKYRERISYDEACRLDDIAAEHITALRDRELPLRRAGFGAVISLLFAWLALYERKWMIACGAGTASIILAGYALWKAWELFGLRLLPFIRRK